MKLLKLKPATDLINGIQTPCYGIFAGNELVRKVSVFQYDEALFIVNRANAIIERQANDMVSNARKEAACGILAANHYRRMKVDNALRGLGA